MTDTSPAFINALLQIAWADGDLDTNEAKIILSTLQKLGMSEEVARKTLETSPTETDLQDVAQALSSKEERLALLKLMMEVSFADDVLSVDEYLILERAEEALGISSDEAEALRKELTA
jgi:uncharacterized tellurite resistance protein B-like protein